MALRIWEKIEYVRRQPEHIRMRYLLGCLSVSMLFILVIWILTLHESFTAISKDAPNVIEQGKEALPEAPAQSLNDLMEQSESLRVEGSASGEEGFFEEQLDKKAGGAEE